MTRQCSRCGSRVPAGVSFFCHRCGARLECEEAAEYPVCPRCGRSQSDRNSHFCDRCGVQLVPPARPVSPDSSMHPVCTCPACGHPNPGDDVRYCKKCGRPLSNEMPRGALKRRESRNSSLEPDIMDGAAGQENIQKKKPVQKAGPLSRFTGKVSWKVATGIVIFFLVLAVGFFIITGGSENKMGAGSDSSLNAGSPVPLPFGSLFGTVPENSSAVSKPGATGTGISATPSKTKTPVPFSNRAAPVVTEKSLKVK